MFFDSLFSSETKMWSINEHRVEKYKVKVRGTEQAGDWKGKTARTRNKFRCVDCEKRFNSKDKFKSEECFEVIKDGS